MSKTNNTISKTKKTTKKPRSRFFTTFWWLIFLLFIATTILVWMTYSMLIQGEKEVYQSPADQPLEVAPITIINPSDTQAPPPEQAGQEDVEKLEPIESTAVEEPVDIDKVGQPLDPTNQGRFDNLF